MIRLFHAFISLIHIGFALLGLSIIAGFAIVVPVIMNILAFLGLIFIAIGSIATLIIDYKENHEDTEESGDD